MYMNQTSKPLSISARTGAFVRGIVGKGPLVEVARKGLSSNVPDKDAEQYAKKLISHAGPVELSDMLANGEVKSKKGQEIIAQALLTECSVTGANEGFSLLAEDTLTSGNVESEEAQEMLASMLMTVVTSRMEDSSFGFESDEAFKIWKAGKVTSEKAKEHLAWCIHYNGTVSQAVEVFKLGPLGVTAQMYLSKKISYEGKPVQSYEALMSGNASFDVAQMQFASVILRKGTPAMARTALMSDVVTDPEAVVFLKQALKG